MSSNRFKPGIIVASLIIALVALLFSGCGSKQSARSGSPAPSSSTPDVSVPSEPEASSPVPPTVPSPEPSEPSPPPAAPEPEPGPEPSTAGPVSGSAEGEGFKVAITADPIEQATGGQIGLVLVVTNSSGQERAFTLPSSQKYDFVAYDSNGKAAWRWSSDRCFTFAIEGVSFSPEQSNTYAETWPTPGLPPGEYTVEGHFVGLPDVKPRVTISIDR